MSAHAPVRRVVVGITGASGILYGIRTLECLRRLEIETHLVMTRAAHVTLTHELPWTARAGQGPGKRPLRLDRHRRGHCQRFVSAPWG